MNDTVLYRERLPTYAFNGSRETRNKIRIWRGVTRLVTTIIIILMLYLVLRPHSEHDLLPVWCGIITMVFLVLVLVYKSEFLLQAEIDGSFQTVIHDDHIAIPPRFRRRLFISPDSIHREGINHVRVIRGRAAHLLENNQVLFWEDSPIGIKIVTTKGKAFSLGYKPPSTVKDIIDVLMTHWNIRIDDPGSGMGHGRLCGKEGPMWERSYEEIMAMDLFEWQE